MQTVHPEGDFLPGGLTHIDNRWGELLPLYQLPGSIEAHTVLRRQHRAALRHVMTLVA